MKKKEEGKRASLMEVIRKEVSKNKALPLYDYRVSNNYLPVIGSGNLFSNIVFIGEAPGKNEALIGKPFVGRSGKMLDQLLESIKMKRDDVYITNIVKDRPQDNRDPLPHEIDFYAEYLDRQLDIIKPKVIATLGRFSMSYILNKFDSPKKDIPISKLHGKKILVTTKYGPVTVVPLYHPAVALYNPNTKNELIKDFKVLKKIGN